MITTKKISLAINALSCLIILNSYAAEKTIKKLDDLQQLYAQLKKENKTIITFIGYSVAEYESNQEMLDIVDNVLKQFDSSSLVVAAGFDDIGIGQVYKQAKKHNIPTIGLAPIKFLNSAKFTPSTYADQMYYIEKKLDENDSLSAVSQARIALSDFFVVIGGGPVAAEELKAAFIKDKSKVTFYAADMNHKKAIDFAKSQNQAGPISFEGSAALVWTDLHK